MLAAGQERTHVESLLERSKARVDMMGGLTLFDSFGSLEVLLQSLVKEKMELIANLFLSCWVLTVHEQVDLLLQTIYGFSRASANSDSVDVGADASPSGKALAHSVSAVCVLDHADRVVENEPQLIKLVPQVVFLNDPGRSSFPENVDSCLSDLGGKIWLVRAVKLSVVGALRRLCSGHMVLGNLMVSLCPVATLGRRKIGQSLNWCLCGFVILHVSYRACWVVRTTVSAGFS